MQYRKLGKWGIKLSEIALGSWMTDLTGTAEEVWHYRYVGKEAAKEIYEQGVCLEEYLEQKKGGNGQ